MNFRKELLKLITEDRKNLDSLAGKRHLDEYLNAEDRGSNGDGHWIFGYEAALNRIEALLAPSIQKTPGVCGGRACIHRTRIPVWLLIRYQKKGLTDKELIQIFPGLDQDDLEAAREYFSSNQEEILLDIKENFE